MSLLFAQPQQLYLEILSEDQKLAWQESQQLTDSNSQWRSYLNRLLLNSFVSYLQEDQLLSTTTASQEKLTSIWSLLDGTLLVINGQKFLLLPTETIDDDEIRVPQEWVDIPSWIADYYIFAEINPDEEWIRIKGYTTHLQIKQQGCYDSIFREYSLTSEQLTEDLNVLWLSQQFCTAEVRKMGVNMINDINPQQAENLIQRLGNPEVIFPRLEIPFSLWGKLLENEDYLHHVSQLRQGQQKIRISITKLSEWGKNIIDELWQPPSNFVYSRTEKNVIENSQIKQKAITIDNQQVILVLEISEENNNKRSIKIELYPCENSRYLPANIQLTLISSEGQVLKSTQARNQDNFIAINKFKAPLNLSFKVEVKLDLAIHTEDFIV